MVFLNEQENGIIFLRISKKLGRCRILHVDAVPLIRLKLRNTWSHERNERKLNLNFNDTIKVIRKFGVCVDNFILSKEWNSFNGSFEIEANI